MNVRLLLLFDTGELLFDRNSPTDPPDIIFSPKDDITGFDPDIENLSVQTLKFMNVVPLCVRVTLVSHPLECGR